MSCEHNKLEHCAHACCSPIVVQVPGLQGASFDWTTTTEEERNSIAERIFQPIKEETSAAIEQSKINAEQSKVYAQLSKGSADKILENQTEIIAKVEAEGDKQVKRIDALASISVITSGLGNAEITWQVTSDIPADSVIELPEGLSYLVGRHHIRIALNGAVQGYAVDFNENGSNESLSTSYVTLKEYKTGDILNVWVGALNTSSSEIDSLKRLVDKSWVNTEIGKHDASWFKQWHFNGLFKLKNLANIAKMSQIATEHAMNSYIIPDPETYFLEVYGIPDNEKIIGDILVQEKAFSPDPSGVLNKILSNN